MRRIRNPKSSSGIVRRWVAWAWAVLAAIQLAGTTFAAPLPDDQKEKTVEYLHSVQNDDGGYRSSKAVGASQLEPTALCMRALVLLGARPDDQRGLGLFILSCYDPESGGFSDTPGVTPEVRFTARGLIAMSGTRSGGDRAAKATAYLLKHAKTIPDIAVATAAFEATNRKLPDPAPWLAILEGSRKPDGSYGSGPAETALAAAAIVRLGGSVPNPEPVVRLLKEAQRPDGSFALPGEITGIPAAYTVVRALTLLKEKPDTAKLKEFLARCRNDDGGYGHTPEQASSVSATFDAVSILSWLEP